MNTYSIKSVADLDALVEKMTEPCSEQGPINTNDINVYVHYYGDDSPGEKDTSPAGFSVYMAWSEAKEKVLARLSTEDVKAFHATIDSFQKNTKAGADNAANRKVLSEYYKKILACTEDERRPWPKPSSNRTSSRALVSASARTRDRSSWSSMAVSAMR
jgi:hypothetical protein